MVGDCNVVVVLGWDTRFFVVGIDFVMEEVGIGFILVIWRVVFGCVVEMYCVIVFIKFKELLFLIIIIYYGWLFKNIIIRVF